MGVMESQLEFARVTVAGGPAVEFCVDPQANDPVVPWLLEHDWIDEPVMRAFQSLVTPGARVLDLGSHLGLFSLPAAALGAEVIGVDANAQHVRLLREAARRNGFEKLEVVQAAVTDAEQPVEFVDQSIHGHIRVPEDGDSAAVTLAGVTIEGLLARRGWDAVDVIKLDIEGAEMGALRGMRNLHAGGARPAMVFECNAAMLPLFGESICRLRKLIAEFGYELLLIDHLRPGTLIEYPSALAIQPECVCDYMAVVDRPDGLADRWALEGPFTLEQTVTRLMDTASHDGEGYRRYAAELITEGPGWLRQHPLVPAVQRALELDPSSLVRSALQARSRPGPAAEHAAEPAPGEGGPPDDIAALASGLALRARTPIPERPGEPSPEELVLSGVSLHVRAGQLLAVVADDPDASSALMRAFAGLEEPVLGELDVTGATTMIGGDEVGFEPGLDVAENIGVFGAFLGCDVPELSQRVRELAARAGVADRLELPLSEAGDETAARIALTVALECADPGLLLVDALPSLGDSEFRQWLEARIGALREEGGAVVQVIEEPGELLAAADRALSVAEGRVVACGNPDAIFEDVFAGPVATGAWGQ